MSESESNGVDDNHLLSPTSISSPVASPSSTSSSSTDHLRFAIPKGRMKDNVLQLLKEAGINVIISDRGYRPQINLPNYDVKLLKPQNIIEMLHAGSRDVGFGGADWVANLKADNLIDLLDTGMDPVKVVAAAPSEQMLIDAIDKGTHITIASEYEELTRQWISKKQLNASFVRAYGATESFPPEDADMIVDNTATGSTLKANNLIILDTVFISSTRLYANKDSLNNPIKKAMIDNLVVLLKSVLLARKKQMIMFNCTSEVLESLITGNKETTLPCMRAPTISQLHHNAGFAVSICVDKETVPTLLPRLKAAGADDIIVTKVEQIVI